MNVARILKYLSSFRKTAWELDDYPVRIWRQEAPPDLPPPAPWAAHLQGSWLVGLGSTPDEALSDLQDWFEELRREGPLPRPGTRFPLRMAAGEEIERHGRFAHEFVAAVVGVRASLITDGTRLDDFSPPRPLPAVLARIRRVYDVDVEDIAHEPLWRILDRIRSSR